MEKYEQNFIRNLTLHTTIIASNGNSGPFFLFLRRSLSDAVLSVLIIHFPPFITPQPHLVETFWSPFLYISGLEDDYVYAIGVVKYTYSFCFKPCNLDRKKHKSLWLRNLFVNISCRETFLKCKVSPEKCFKQYLCKIQVYSQINLLPYIVCFSPFFGTISVMQPHCHCDDRSYRFRYNFDSFDVIVYYWNRYTNNTH